MMLFCKDCAEDNEWDEATRQKLGACTSCGKRTWCIELPSFRFLWIDPLGKIPKEYMDFQEFLAKQIG